MTRRRLGLVVFAWSWQLAFAGMAAAIVAARVGIVYGQSPTGDTALWRDGGLELFDVILHARLELSSFQASLAVVLALGTILGAFPHALLLTDARRATRASAGIVRDALPALPTLVALRLLFLAVGYLLYVAVPLAAQLGQAIASRAGDVRADETGLAFALVVLLALVPLNVGIDAIGATTVVQRRPTLRRALLRGYELLRRDGGRLTLAWTWRTLLGLAFVALGGVMASRLGGRAGAPVLGLAFAHQVIALARTALRASWLTLAVRRAELRRTDDPW